MILKLLGPLFKKFSKLIVSMIGVSMLGIAMMTGLSGAYDTLDISLNDYVRDYHYTDITLTTGQTDAATERALAGVSGVKDAQGRVVADIPVRLKNGRLLSMRVFSVSIRDFQNFYVWEMDEGRDYPNIAAEYRFAEDNGLKVGDILEVKIDGEFREVRIGSLVSSAECLSVIRDSYSWGENADFGYLFASENLAYGTPLYQQYNQFLIRLEPEADAERVLADLTQVLEERGVEIGSANLYEDSPVYKKIDINLQPIRTLSLFTPAVFFISMIAVLSLFLSQIINQCRRDIGVLRAFGFKKGHIRALYCVLTLIITLIASVIGIGVGYALMILTGRMYGEFFALPHLTYFMNPVYIVIAVAATILFGQLAALISTRKLSKIMPSEAMSREHTEGSVRRSGNGLKHFSPAMKFGITSALRNRKRFVFSTFCIAVSITLILTSIAFYVSKDSILEQLYDERTHYDAQIFLTEKPTEDQLRELGEQPGISEVQTMTYAKFTAESLGNSADVTVCGLSAETDAVQVFDAEGRRIPIPESGLILERHTAEEWGLNEGDFLFINEKRIEIKAISDQSVNRIQYVSAGTMETLGEVDQYSVLCRCSDEQGLLDYASGWESYSYTDFIEQLRAGNEKTFSTYSLGVYIIIGFAVFLGLLIVVNTTQMNLFEQKKSLSVLRTMGFRISDISRMWMFQTMLQFILSCLIGLPVGTFVAKYALKQMATEGREYPFIADPVQCIVTVLIVLAYIVISHFAAMRSIKKWDLVENIKEKE